MEKVFEIYIRTTPERLLGGDHRPCDPARYHFGRASSLTGHRIAL
jgi:hypothetical protein